MITDQKLSLFFFFIFFLPISSSTDTLTPSQPLSYPKTLISSNKTFALGFFTPPNSTNRYIGIWYNNNPAITTIVWVANRRNPVPNLAATLSISAATASLHLLAAGNSTPLWSSPPFPHSPNSSAQLLDTGNLIIKSPNSPSIILWQSFDHPTDTMLPGMRIGPNLKTGVDRNLTAWSSPSDPSPGNYALAIDPAGVPQMVTRRVDSRSWLWRGGPWSGFGFTGASPNQDFTVELDRALLPSFNQTPEEIYYIFSVMGGSLSILNIDPGGIVLRSVWLDSSRSISGRWIAPHDDCDLFGFCGVNSVCDSGGSAICRCLDGFYPRDWVGWGRGEWGDGCERGVGIDCAANGSGEFAVIRGVKLPDTREAVEDMRLGLDECRARCLMNCSCQAYANAYFTEGGIGCIVWMGDVRDVRVYGSGGQNLFVRVAGPREGMLLF